MVRLRTAVMAVALGTGAMGCGFSQPHIAHYSIWHCDECDDFPMPAYGPGYSMMPGTYTGVTPNDTVESNRPLTAAPGTGSGSLPQQQPAATTPPAPPAAGPGSGAATRQPSTGAAGPTSVLPAPTESNLPPLPPATRNELSVPGAKP